MLLYMSESKRKIKPKKSLAVDQFVQKLNKDSIEEIKAVVGYEQLKLDPRLIRDLMIFVETVVSESKYRKENINKLELVVDVWKNVFQISDDEEKILRDIMNAALEDKTVKIKKCSTSKILKKALNILNILLK